MLRAEIIIMREGSTQVLAINSFRQAWRYGDRDRWDKRTLALAALEVDDPHKQPEVFICLRMDEPSDLLDRNYVANLIRKVRAHTWGANLYVVFDSQIKIRRVTDNPELLAALLKEIYQAGATDVIHVSMPQLYEYEAQVFNLPATLKGLFESAALSQQRQSKLQTGKQ